MFTGSRLGCSGRNARFASIPTRRVSEGPDRPRMVARSLAYAAGYENGPSLTQRVMKEGRSPRERLHSPRRNPKKKTRHETLGPVASCKRAAKRIRLYRFALSAFVSMDGDGAGGAGSDGVVWAGGTAFDGSAAGWPLALTAGESK